MDSAQCWTDEALTGGSMKYISNQVSISPELILQAEKFAGEGKTPLLFTKNNKLIGYDRSGRCYERGQPAGSKGTAEYGNPCCYADW